MNILISGKNSYIGSHIMQWLSQDKFEELYSISELDVQHEDWEKYDLSKVDVIIHVAGIVHRKDEVSLDTYMAVNADLPYELASKAQKQGVTHFIFFSTMAVYGLGKALGKGNIIDSNTALKPCSPYGISKLAGEQKLEALNSADFTVSIIRPPNVYGKNCRGGYISGYKSILHKVPMIPYAYDHIKQSVLYIDNLAELCRLLIEHRKAGIFTPQDDKAVSAVELMQAICNANGMDKRFSCVLGWFILLIKFLPVVCKGYGGVCYLDMTSKVEFGDYVVVPFEEAIRRTLSCED